MAVGTQMAWPYKRVVAIVGGGAALFGIHALWTAARRKLSVIVIILDHRSYAPQYLFIVSQVQQPPSTSPVSTASRTSAVPLYPSTTSIGWPKTAFRNRGTSTIVAPGAVSPNLNWLLGSKPFFHIFDTASFRKHASLVICLRRPYPLKPPRIKFDPLSSHDLLKDKPPGPVSDCETIGLRPVIDVVTRNQTARSGHVFHYGGRPARDALTDMPRDHSRVTRQILLPPHALLRSGWSFPYKILQLTP